MKNWLLPILVYVIICISIFIFQRSLMYFPYPSEQVSPQWQIIKSENEILALASSLDKPHTLIVFHGNAGNASMREYYKQLTPSNTNLVIAEYPGFGLNSSESINKGAMIKKSRLLMQKIKGEVSVLGESIGSALAAQMAAEFKAEKLLLITPYNNIASVAQDKMWFLPAYFLTKDRWDTVDAISNYKGHALLLIAKKDQVIPPKFSNSLYDQIKSQKDKIEIPNAGHNDWMSHLSQADLNKLIEFLS